MKVSMISALSGMALSLAVATSAQSQSASWTGYYAGLSYGSVSGDVTVGGLAPSTYDLEGEEMALFVGYNLQRGNLVYGGELAFSAADVGIEVSPNEHYTEFLDLKGRLGYATGKALVYGTLGYSLNTFENPDTSNGSGFAFGVGAEYQVTDRIFAGLEYLYRDIHNDETPSVSALDSQLGMLSLRVAMRF